MGRRNRLRKKWRKKRQKNKSLKLEKRQLAADFERKKKKKNTINEKKRENEKERTSVKACISSYKSVSSSLMLVLLRF